MHGICRLEAHEAAAWLSRRQAQGAVAFVLTPFGDI